MSKRSENIQTQIDAIERDLQLGNVTHTEYIQLTQDLLNDKNEALREEAGE